MSDTEIKFYSLWEDFVANLSDTDLEITIKMLSRYPKEITQIVRDEYSYRNATALTFSDG
jgi:hypothetical protein